MSSIELVYKLNLICDDGLASTSSSANECASEMEKI